jgi:alpha-N-acetylglucosamine transferase
LLVIVLFINLIAFTFQGGLREPLPIDGDLNPDTSIPPHHDTSTPGPLIPGTHQNASDRDYSKEAYVTLLSPSDPHPWAEGRTDVYFEACKVIAHRLLRNSTTRDPYNRPYIILVTSLVPQKQIKILESHGVIVKHVSTIAPPKGTVNFKHINPRYKDQFTKLHVWNMTEYNRIAFFDADTLPIQPIHTIFDTPTQQKGDEEWLFAAVYDSGNSRADNQRNPPGPEDKGRPEDVDLNAGVFLLKPTQTQSEYIFEMFRNPPKRDFTVFMEQSMLRWAYRDGGPYPWIRLSHLYNTQWCREVDLDSAWVLHDKLWGGGRGKDDKLRRKWYEAWGEMLGWAASRYGGGVQEWEQEEGKIVCDPANALIAND